MKKLAILIVILVAGLVIYNYATTGKVALLPASMSMSADERAVAELEERFDAARQQYSQAERGAGLTGMDTTGDAEGALRSVDRIAGDLAKLQQELSPGPAKQRAETLAANIEGYKRSLH